MRLCRPQFRLRTLLLLLAVVAACFGVAGTQWRAREKQYQAAARLKPKGIRAFARGEPSWWLRPPIDTVEIDEYLGVRTDGVTWEAVRRPSGERLTVADVAELAAFPQLRRLHLQGEVVVPAAIDEIAKLTSLRQLTIAHYPLEDEQMLRFAQLKNLEELTLEATQTTDGAIDRLREKLPELEVYDD